MSSALLFTVSNSRPIPTGVTTPAGASGIPSGNYSLLLVAYRTSAEGDDDTAGWDKTALAAMQNIAFATDDTAVVAFTPPLDVNGIPDYPHHYSLYTQAAATWNYANAGRKVATTTNRFATSITMSDYTSLGTNTFASTAASMIIDPCIYPGGHVVRAKVEVAAQGNYRELALANTSAVERLPIKFFGGSTTHSNFSRLLKWQTSPVRVNVTEYETTDAEADSPIQVYEGYIVESDNLNDKYKNQNTVYGIVLGTDYTSASAQVPVT